MPVAFRVVENILVRVTDTMSYYMIEEGDPIWILMVSKDTDDDGMTSNNGGGLATQATWYYWPYYWPSDPGGSRCSIWRRRRRPFGALQVVAMKVEGERDDIKGLVEMIYKG